MRGSRWLLLVALLALPVVPAGAANQTVSVVDDAFVPSSVTVSQGEMHVEMYSTKFWDIKAGVSERYNYTSPETRYISSDDCVPTTGYSGFSVDVYRSFRKPGSSELVKKETQSVTYIPADTVICSAPPSSDDGDG